MAGTIRVFRTEYCDVLIGRSCLVIDSQGTAMQAFYFVCDLLMFDSAIRVTAGRCSSVLLPTLGLTESAE